ncbi:50S ribosomal protein L25 [Candidatus Hodgkinia cicadicola]|nr:50S ribosomal protein L25 [Candidatus Hodgkinia cicadicola]
MLELPLLPRLRRGSKACKLLRASGFVPGLIRIDKRVISVCVCVKLIKRLSYRQIVCATLSSQVMFLKLAHYQLNPMTFEIQHVEYHDCKRALNNTETRILVFKSANCALVRSGAKPKTLYTTLNVIGEASVAPNYIKVDISEYVKGENVIMTRLCCKCVQFATTKPNCVLVTMC